MSDDSPAENPFREHLISRSRPGPCSLVIFGATGDLTHRKLIPALYNIGVDGDLPPQFKVIGFARRDKDDAMFQGELEESNQKHSRQGHDDELWADFASGIHYHQSTFDDDEGYRSLKKRLDQYDEERGAPANRLFYLAISPDFFDDVLIKIREHGLSEPSAPDRWSKVIVEKPFGTDLPSAQHLNKVVNETFPEEDVYRIDHYLGKETAQNIMVLRFANTIFEPLWRNRFIDHVQITCAENLGMEGGRGGYYDKSGAARDMVQNHLLQLLSLVAMEPPTDLSADSVRDEKVKVIRSLRPITGEDVAKHVVRAQYVAGSVDGVEKPGYRGEDRVDPESNTETYVAIRAHIDTWRWDGVPFYIRVGKQLPKKATEISIHFKDSPNVPFNTSSLLAAKNVLVIRIQPDEGVSLRMLCKMPGTSPRIEPVKMDFQYSESFGKASPEAYERLLLDSMAGDATLFARRDEVEHAWRFMDAIEEAWHGDSQPAMTEYPAGSWGPKEADALLEEDGRVWRRL